MTAAAAKLREETVGFEETGSKDRTGSPDKAAMWLYWQSVASLPFVEVLPAAASVPAFVTAVIVVVAAAGAAGETEMVVAVFVVAVAAGS